MLKFSQQNFSEEIDYGIMASRPVSQKSLTIPNLITLIRILLTPIFIICLIQGYYHKALAIFVLAGLSDLADGLIARAWHQRSRLGSYLDPLADKVLMVASFLTLSIYREIPAWLTVLVLSRDVILGLGFVIFRLADIPLVVRPTLAGKWTTTFQVITVFLVLVGKIWPIPASVLMVFFWVTGTLTTISGIHYFYGGIKMINASHGNGPREDGSG
jgi:cardiolipin synthase (CMP-forming)